MTLLSRSTTCEREILRFLSTPCAGQLHAETVRVAFVLAWQPRVGESGVGSPICRQREPNCCRYLITRICLGEKGFTFSRPKNETRRHHNRQLQVYIIIVQVDSRRSKKRKKGLKMHPKPTTQYQYKITTICHLNYNCTPNNTTACFDHYNFFN